MFCHRPLNGLCTLPAKRAFLREQPEYLDPAPPQSNNQTLSIQDADNVSPKQIGCDPLRLAATEAVATTIQQNIDLLPDVLVYRRSGIFERAPILNRESRASPA